MFANIRRARVQKKYFHLQRKIHAKTATHQTRRIANSWKNQLSIPH